MTSAVTRALVLGSGGATGIAWEAGMLAGLAEAGLPLTAESVVGTSAGALVAARLTTGWSPERLFAAAAVPAPPPARLTGPALLALLLAQAYPSRRHALAWLGRRAARAWTPEAEARWINHLVPELSGVPWPPELVIVATDASSGRPAYFSAGQPTDLARAVAASCAIPGVFPAVRVDGRLHLDGGLRSPANLDVVPQATSMIALAPLTASLRAHRRPGAQAQVVGRRAAVLLLQPDRASRRAMGPDLLAGVRNAEVARAGREQGLLAAAALGGAWPG